jgi:hypothetical protein
MFTFVVPPDVILDPPPIIAAAIKRAGGTTPETFTFQRIALECWLNDARAIRSGPPGQEGGSLVKQQRWSKVIEKFLTIKGPGDSISLEDEDFRSLKMIVESPSAYYSPLIASYLTPFSEAVLAAKSG